MMKLPEVFVKSLSFSDKTTLSLGPDDLVVFVGPNNSGKSLALREIRTLFSKPDGSSMTTLCVKDVEISRNMNSTELRAYFQQFPIVDNQYVIGRNRVHDSHIGFFDGRYLHALGVVFCSYIGAEGRINASNPVGNVDITEQKTSPIHFMYDDEGMLDRVSALFRSAFSQDLMIDYRAGSVIPIHVGERVKRTKKEDRVSSSYVSKVRALPRLENQGDGMRSFAGILFETIVNENLVTLIDEPEAFLHPPQMRRIGNILANELKHQLFVSTHSSDILRGFLERNNSRVRVVRLRRNGDVNIIHEAEPAKVKAIWENPDLKYTNALEAIFHDRCIICEDDSDCKFYNAIRDYLEACSQGSSWPDTIFVPCGGKAAMPKLASALRALGVPVSLVFDIDILSEKSGLKAAIESLGGSWGRYEKDWKIVDSGVRNGIKPLSTEEIKTAIATALSEAGSDHLPKSEIEALLKRRSPWQTLKDRGANGIPKGEATRAFASLIKDLAAIGLHVVPVGEIENFARHIGKHGPAYVSEVLNTLDLNSEALREARTFVASFDAGV